MSVSTGYYSLSGQNIILLRGGLSRMHLVDVDITYLQAEVDAICTKVIATESVDITKTIRAISFSSTSTAAILTVDIVKEMRNINVIV